MSGRICHIVPDMPTTQKNCTKATPSIYRIHLLSSLLFLLRVVCLTIRRHPCSTTVPSLSTEKIDTIVLSLVPVATDIAVLRMPPRYVQQLSVLALPVLCSTECLSWFFVIYL